MAGPVLHIGNQFLTFSRSAAQFFIHQAAEQFRQVNILPFVEPPDIVGIAGAAFVKYEVDGSSVVLHKQPVARVQPIPINRERLFSMML